MKTKKEKQHAKEVAEDNRPCAGCADLRRELAAAQKQSAGYGKTIVALQRQLVEARTPQLVRVLYGQEVDGRHVVDEQYTAERAGEVRAGRRAALQKELDELEKAG